MKRSSIVLEIRIFDDFLCDFSKTMLLNKPVEYIFYDKRFYINLSGILPIGKF